MFTHTIPMVVLTVPQSHCKAPTICSVIRMWSFSPFSPWLWSKCHLTICMVHPLCSTFITVGTKHMNGIFPKIHQIVRKKGSIGMYSSRDIAHWGGDRTAMGKWDSWSHGIGQEATTNEPGTQLSFAFPFVWDSVLWMMTLTDRMGLLTLDNLV